MSYSSIVEFRGNVSQLPIASMADADVTDKITKADNLIRVKLSKLVDFSVVVDTPAGCPAYINKLSQYKTAELCCVDAWGAKRNVMEQSDRQYWAAEYMELLNELFDGEIDLGAVGVGSGTFENTHREGVEPALGMGQNGEWLDDDEIESQRAEFGNQED